MADEYPKNRLVYTLGETLLDMVSDGGIAFRALPGGSVLNTSVSLGRMGIDVSLISEYGYDQPGCLIHDFLHLNSVKTSFCFRYKTNKTALALAFLDNKKNAKYSFYHDYPETTPEYTLPVFCKDDILLFGSSFSVKPSRRNLVLKMLQEAVKVKMIVYYDLNIRKTINKDIDTLMPDYMNNMAVTTVVKGSDEDFCHLFGINDSVAIYEKVKPFCKILIITKGVKPLEIFTPLLHKTYSIPAIDPVSTIGAGDNFNAGFIYGLSTSGIEAANIAGISENELDRLVGCGLAFASETCLSAENYISRNFDPGLWRNYIDGYRS